MHGHPPSITVMPRWRRRWYTTLLPWPCGVLDTPVTATRLLARNSAVACFIVGISRPPRARSVHIAALGSHALLWVLPGFGCIRRLWPLLVPRRRVMRSRSRAPPGTGFAVQQEEELGGPVTGQRADHAVARWLGDAPAGEGDGDRPGGLQRCPASADQDRDGHQPCGPAQREVAGSRYCDGRARGE